MTAKSPRRRLGRSSLCALAVVALGACAASVQPGGDGAPSTGEALHEGPPVGEYALTDSISFVIRRDRTSGVVAPRWTVQVGEGERYVVAATPHGWSVPALDLEFQWAARDGIGGLLLRRYGESVFVTRGAPPADQAQSTSDALAELTPRLMIALDVPGVGIALIRNGEIAWRGYFGVERSGTTERIDSLTVFEAASMSKPAYAYPFMKLVEGGAIALDTPLVRYLGRDYIEGDTLHRAITARMVLSHTTGFPNWRGDDGLTVEFVPGTQIGYSGEGFQYLQTVAEAVTGTPMAAFTRASLLDPLGLSSASYVWLDRYDDIAASGHDADGVPRAREPYTEPNSAYTLYITPVDYARILLEIMRADRSAPHSLSEATRDTMLASQHVVPDREPIARGGVVEGQVHFTLGWRFDRTASGDRYWHSGSNSTGFQCYAEFDPATGDGIVIMTNSSSGSPLWRALMNATGRP